MSVCVPQSCVAGLLLFIFSSSSLGCVILPTLMYCAGQKNLTSGCLGLHFAAFTYYRILICPLNNMSPYVLQDVHGTDCRYVNVHNSVCMHNYKIIIVIANKVEKYEKRTPSIWHTTSHLFIHILFVTLIKSLENLNLKCYPEYAVTFF